jgi:hypothetical protein
MELKDLLSKLSSRGTWGLIGANALFVIILVYLYQKWKATAGVEKCLQIASIFLPFVCLVGVFLVYYRVFGRIDSTIVPEDSASEDETPDEEQKVKDKE